MAFVFRSEKESYFDTKKQQQTTSKLSQLSNQQSQLNGTSYSINPDQGIQKSPGKLLKGLPSLLKKDKNSTPDISLFEKQNSYNEQSKSQLKVNLERLKRSTQNYFFSSKVPRNLDFAPFQSINNNLTCTQFSTNLNQINQNCSHKKQVSPNHTAPKFTVNRSLIDSESVKDLRRKINETLPNTCQAQKLLVNFSTEMNGKFRRKCSLPQSLEKTTYHTVLRKINELRQSNRQKSLDNQAQIFMKTINESDKSSLKKSPTEKKLMKLHKGNLQNSFYKQSQSQQSETQYDGDDLPGPGTYDNTANLKQKKSFRSKKQKFTKIFVSPLERFKTQQLKYQDVTYLNEGKKQKNSPSHFFLSKTPKNLQIQERTNSPPIGSYNPRDTIEHDIVRNLLKSSNVPNFNSSMPRFKNTKINMMPGPGHYNVEALEKARQEEIKNQLSSSYKSQVKRCVNQISHQNNQQDKSRIQIGGKQDENVVIHKRQQNFDSSEFFSPPPFFSSVERFPEPQVRDSGSDMFLRLGKRSLKQEVKNNSQPFNSTAKKQLDQKVGEGVGVGSYLVEKDRWNKKSYNVYFN